MASLAVVSEVLVVCIDAQEEISEALEAHPEVSLIIVDMQVLFDTIPADARRAALLLLVGSLVPRIANDPRRAQVEMQAHTLDALRDALSI